MLFFLWDYVQKREKKKWLFRKPALHVVERCEPKSNTNDSILETSAKNPVTVAADQRHAMVVAAAKAAAAEAAAATAQAAVEIVRLTRHSIFVTEEYYAAVVIQTAFRGYLVSLLNYMKTKNRTQNEKKILSFFFFLVFF